MRWVFEHLVPMLIMAAILSLWAIILPVLRDMTPHWGSWNWNDK